MVHGKEQRANSQQPFAVYLLVMFGDIRQTIYELHPSVRQLRLFGLVLLALLGFFAYRFPSARLVLTGVELLIFAGLFYPQVLQWVYLALMALTLPIGWLLSRLVLTLFFVVVISPFGTIRRLTGRDPLHLRFREHDTTSYWEDVEQNAHFDKMHL
ncbi:MAG: SxtJ family membrane protein [bacterium]|nr:SxtJ family membrane protein [bacterium]MDZ4296568.1 SxtJ family membrane protein [Patescibacteria group bacterium]